MGLLSEDVVSLVLGPIELKSYPLQWDLAKSNAICCSFAYVALPLRFIGKLLHWSPTIFTMGYFYLTK